jgi:phosphoenolpyruvate---glycerone phosphotransferase subunit DhaL
MESFPDEGGGVVVRDMARAIQENAMALSEIDGAIGDGDHGINMAKGFAMCRERLGEKTGRLSEGLRTLGEVLMGEIGGAMGPLYGTLFGEMAAAAAGATRIDAALFGRMLERATRAVTELGGARVGDKTMIDALVPAADAFNRSAGSGKDFAGSLSVMADAAERGKESTRELVAKVGRASRLGERSRGTLDPGAASCALLLGSMARSMTALLDETTSPPR